MTFLVTLLHYVLQLTIHLGFVINLSRLLDFEIDIV
jgi:hypothetical protein